MKDKDKIVAQISDLLENMPDKWVQSLIEAIELIKSLMGEYSDIEVEPDKPNDDQAQADRDKAFESYMEFYDSPLKISLSDVLIKGLSFNGWLELRHMNTLNPTIEYEIVERIDAHYMNK